MTLVEHLEELRDRIMRVLTCLGVTWAIGWWQFRPVYNFLQGIVDSSIKKGLGPSGNEFHNVANSITDPFLLKLKLSFLIGVVISIPYIVLQLWGFIAPALKPSEQRPFKRLAPASTLLFVTGAGFAWAILPESLAWFADQATDFKGLIINQEAGNMVFLIVKMLIAFGVAFQLPLIVFGMGMAGLLSADTLLKYWRHGASVIFVLAAVITPSNDPLSMMVMAIPLTILFIASVYAVKFMQKRQNRPEAQVEATPALLELGEPIAYAEEETKIDTRG